MLLVMISLVLMAVVFLLLAIFCGSKSWDSWTETGYAIVFFLCTIFVVGFLVAAPLSRWADTDFVKQVEAIQLTVDEQREGGEVTEYERATITQKIIETNEKIAWRKNANRAIRLKLWTHPDIMKLKPIK